MGRPDVLFVIDAASFIELESVCTSAGHSFDVVLSRLTDLCTGSQLVFPPLVVRDCRDYGETDVITSWVRSNAAHLSSHVPGYELAAQVVDQCPNLFDVDDQRESAEIEVLALALSRRNAGVPVTVVTGQWVDSPLRQSLGSAAATMGFDAITTRGFVNSVMM
jgi:hypothetical protein